MFGRLTFALSFKSIPQMIVCSRFVARHNYPSLSTNVRRISSFGVRSSCTESLETVKMIVFLASNRSCVPKTSPISPILSDCFDRCSNICFTRNANRSIALQQVNYLHAISETCRKHAETRLSSIMLCLEQKPVTDGVTLLVQVDFTGNNTHPSVIIGLGKRVKFFRVHDVFP